MPFDLPSLLDTSGLAIGANSALHAEAAVAPDRICILPAGTFKGVDGRGPWVNKDPAAIVAASMQTNDGQGIPVDYNHQSVFAVTQGGQSPAAGWIDRLEIQDGAIFAHVAWTQAGAHAVASKEYRFVSPVFTFDKKTGEITAISSVGLVNAPNLAELPAINARNGDQSMDQLLAKLRQALGLPDDAGADDVVSACNSIMKKVKSANAALLPLASTLGLSVAAEAGEIATAANARLVAGAEIDPAKYVPMAAFAELQRNVAAMAAEAGQSKAETAVNAAMAAGKLSPAMADWGRSYAAKDPAGFEAWCSAAPVIVKPGAGSVVTLAPPAGGTVSGIPDEAALAVCARLGITLAQFRANEKDAA